MQTLTEEQLKIRAEMENHNARVREEIRLRSYGSAQDILDEVEE